MTGSQLAMTCLLAAIVGVASGETQSQTLQGYNTTTLLMAGCVGGALAVSVSMASKRPYPPTKTQLVNDGLGFISALICGVMFAPQVYEWLPAAQAMPLRHNNPGALACGGLCGTLGYLFIPAVNSIAKWRLKQVTGKDLDP